MKKLLLTLALLLFALPAGAANGDVIGKIYSTDILALINGKAVPSYNIGGRTAVVLEELEESGFWINIDYNDETRTLKASMSNSANSYLDGVERGTPGKILGNVYESDIKVIINGHEIKGCNIGGKTAVVIEDLGEIGGDNEQYGRSKYRYTYIWSEAERKIELNYIKMDWIFSPAGKTPYTEFFINDNVISAKFDRMNDYGANLCEVKFSDEFKAEREILKPLYYEDGTEVGLICLTDLDEYEFCITKPELFREKTDMLITKTPTADEVLKKFDDKTEYETTAVTELEDYYVIDVTCLKIPERNYLQRYYIAVKKSGGYMIMWTLSTFYDKSRVEKTDKNSVSLYIEPFGGPHGATTMRCDFNFDDYEIL